MRCWVLKDCGGAIPGIGLQLLMVLHDFFYEIKQWSDIMVLLFYASGISFQ